MNKRIVAAQFALGAVSLVTLGTGAVNAGSDFPALQESFESLSHLASPMPQQPHSAPGINTPGVEGEGMVEFGKDICLGVTGAVGLAATLFIPGIVRRRYRPNCSVG